MQREEKFALFFFKRNDGLSYKAATKKTCRGHHSPSAGARGLYGSLKGNKQNLYNINTRLKSITKIHDSKDRAVAFTW